MPDMGAIPSSGNLQATERQKQEGIGRGIAVCFYLPHASPLSILAPARDRKL